jgi:hypothetical protein
MYQFGPVGPSRCPKVPYVLPTFTRPVPPPPPREPTAAGTSTGAHCRRRLHASDTALMYVSYTCLPPPQRDCPDPVVRRRHLASPAPFAQATSHNSTTLLGGSADSWNSTTLQIFDHRIRVCSVHWPDDNEYLHRALR